MAKLSFLKPRQIATKNRAIYRSKSQNQGYNFAAKGLTSAQLVRPEKLLPHHSGLAITL